MLLFLVGCLQIDEAAWTDWLENDVPEISEPVISPDGNIYNDTELTCSATATDGEDGELSISYIWEKNGSQIGQEASISLGNLQVSPGETISCLVSAMDAVGVEVSSATSVTVENRYPVIDTISLSDESPEANEEINCLATASDPDGGEPSLSYEWEVAGDLQGTESSISLSPDFAGVGQEVVCLVSITDAHGGDISDSVTGTIANTSPVISNISVTPSSGVNADSELTCSVVFEDLNEENSELRLSYLWTNDGEEIGTEETIQLGWSIATMGDEIQCEVTVTDEHNASDSATDSVTLGNASPVVQTAATITSSSGFSVGEEAICSAVFTDAEDGFLDSVYNWDVNGTAVGSGASYIIVEEETNMNDVLRCTATATDSQGETATSVVTAIIENSPPVIEDIIITPDPLYNDSTITCTPIISDPDEVPTHTVEWLMANPNGGWITLISANSYNLSSLGPLAPVPGDSLKCEVAAQDSQGETDFESVLVSVENRAPTMPTMEISWTLSGVNNPEANEDSDLTCLAFGSTDDDGDNITYSYEWTSSNGDIHVTSDVPNSLTDVGEVWTCTVTASDGLDDVIVSESVTITSRFSWDYCDTSLDLGAGSYQLIGENSDDFAGYGLSLVGDVDGDGLSDIMVGAYKNDQVATDAGKAYLVLSSSLGSSTVINLGNADYSFTGEAAGDLFGNLVTSGGDVDNDGLSDIVIAARVNNSGTGKIYLFLSSSLGGTSSLTATDADYIFIGEAQEDYAGDVVSSAGDVDGDGFDDILIGAYGNDAGGMQSGKAYLILGSSLGGNSTISLANADYIFSGTSAGEFVGGAVASAGDIDGDGKDDILIGAHGHSSGGFQSGSIGLFFSSSLSSLSSSLTLSSADYLFIGENASAYTRAVSSAGDVDGDGVPDILIGAYGQNKAYLILGSSLGSFSTIDLSNADYGFLGEAASNYTGYSVSLAGDIDNDGLDDILIGAYDYDNFLGRTYLILGSSLGVSSSISLSNSDYIFSGETASDMSGFTISGGGDITGNNLDDILISAQASDSNGANSGKAVLFTGCE